MRSYLAVNCAYCHHPGGAGPGSWDASPNLTLWQTHIINGLPLAAGSGLNDRIVIPGDLNRSILWDRMLGTNSYTRMPPVATHELDHQAIKLVSEWITNTLPSRLDYAAWRQSNFGDTTSPDGAPDADPDGDHQTDQAEFLKHTNPRDGSDYSEPEVRVLGGEVEVAVPGWPDRRVTVETSLDLGFTDPWILWTVPGNDGVPLATPATNRLSSPVNGSNRFFRINISEE